MIDIHIIERHIHMIVINSNDSDRRASNSNNY